MCVPMALRLHDGNDRDELFLCLLRIKFWVLIFIFEGPCIPLAVYCVKLVAYDRRVANKLRKGLDKALHKSYNTTPAEEWWRYSLLLAAWFFWPHVYHLFSDGWPHMAVGVFFFALSVFTFNSSCISSLPAERFWALLPPENKTTYQSFGTRIWPHLWP